MLGERGVGRERERERKRGNKEAKDEVNDAEGRNTNESRWKEWG
jgi:hypothetical protein